MLKAHALSSLEPTTEKRAPRLAVAAAPAESSAVLYLGASMPWVLETALVSYGYLVDQGRTLEAGSRLLRQATYRVVLCEHLLPDADMVALSAALHAGAPLGYDLPVSIQSTPVLLLDGPEAVCSIPGGELIELFEDQVADFVLDLLLEMP